jgi:hypothetical protein
MTDHYARAYATISALIFKYPDLVDTGDLHGIADLFARATVRSGDLIFTGRDELLTLWTNAVRTYDNGRTFTKHLVTNVVVNIDDGMRTATAKSYVTVIQAKPPELPLQLISSSRHYDRFECDQDGWYFVERVDVPDLQGDLTYHTPVSSADAKSTNSIPNVEADRIDKEER